MSRSLRAVVKGLIPRWLCSTHLHPAAANTVLITFDDGPDAKVTPAVLDRLRDFEVKAVFFVVGNRVERAPKVLDRILAEGHWIGNHTYSHPNDREMSLMEYRKELIKCQQVVQEHSGVLPTLHRPPRGKISVASLLAPKTCGLSTMIWSHSADDWSHRSDSLAIARAEELATQVQPLDIVLFHDEQMHTVAALDHLLPALRTRGFNLSPELRHLS